MFSNPFKSNQEKPRGFSYTPTYYKPDEERSQRFERYHNTEKKEESIQERIERLRHLSKVSRETKPSSNIINSKTMKPLGMLAGIVLLTYYILKALKIAF
jgi:hypothetical protein